MPYTPQNLSAAETEEARRTAARLIAHYREDSAEYPAELANHLPMLLPILAQLGASSQRLEEYATLYRQIRRQPAMPRPLAPFTPADWQEGLGDRRREADYRRFFAGEVARLGPEGAVRAYLPRLMQAAGSSAFHPLMRLAFGILRSDADEIAIALGFWATTELPLRNEPQGPQGQESPAQLLDFMRQSPAFSAIDIPATAPLWHWMRGVGGMDAFAPLLGRLSPAPETLDAVGAAGLALFAAAPGSLEAVHAMTGGWWVRVVGQWLDAPADLARFFWQAVLAVYPKTGMPALPPAEELAALRAAPAPPRAALAAAALACDPWGDDEEHHPSVVFTAFQEYDRTGDRLYLNAAAKRMGLLD